MYLKLNEVYLVALMTFMVKGHEAFVFCFSTNFFPQSTSLSSLNRLTKHYHSTFSTNTEINNEDSNDQSQNTEIHKHQSKSIMQGTDNGDTNSLLDRRTALGGMSALLVGTVNNMSNPRRAFAADYPQSSPSLLLSSETAICQELGEDEIQRINLFNKVAPGVVYIDTFAELRNSVSTDVTDVPLGAGSGIIWDDKGHIVTNFHVIRNAKKAQIAILRKEEPDSSLLQSTGKKPSTSPLFEISSASKRDRLEDRQQRKSVSPPPPAMLTNGMTSPTMRPGSVPNFIRTVYKARVVGVDPGKDLAVLKVDAPTGTFNPVELGSSKRLRVGQEALAIGNPFGLDHTLTLGVISGTGREVRSPIGLPITNVIQTDAAINPGNSGGALLDLDGKLIGMNTAIYSPSGGSSGVGFAIPVDTLQYVVETLIRDGRIVRPVLGITFLQSKQAKALGITKGVLVLDTPLSSPAFKAGIRGTRRNENGFIELGDIIVKIEDDLVNNEAELLQALETFKPGDKVIVTVERAESLNGEIKMKQLRFVVQLRAESDSIKIKFESKLDKPKKVIFA